jgi:hypothetical protein
MTHATSTYSAAGEPDLQPFVGVITKAMTKAVTKAQVIEQLALVELEAAADLGDGFVEMGQHDILYRLLAARCMRPVRPISMTEAGRELQLANFGAIITDYEAEFGEIEGMYREPRGSLYHPHIGEVLTIGTLMVRSYERPANDNDFNLREVQEAARVIGLQIGAASGDFVQRRGDAMTSAPSDEVSGNSGINREWLRARLKRATHRNLHKLPIDLVAARLIRLCSLKQ